MGKGPSLQQKQVMAMQSILAGKRWVVALVLAVQALLLLIWCHHLATQRAPMVGDEGYYLYDAWKTWAVDGNPSLFTNYGWIVGLPYLFSKSPPILWIRGWSLLLWLGAFGLLFSRYIRYQAQYLFLLALLPFVLASDIFNMASYISLPLIFTALAGFCFVSASQQTGKMQFVLGFLFSVCLSLTVLSYTPQLAVVGLAAISALWVNRNKPFVWGGIMGMVVGMGAIMALTPINPVTLGSFVSGKATVSHYSTPTYGSQSQLVFRSLIRMLYFGFFLLLPGILGGLIALVLSFRFLPEVALSWRWVQWARTSQKAALLVATVGLGGIFLLLAFDNGLVAQMILRSFFLGHRFMVERMTPFHWYSILGVMLIPACLIGLGQVEASKRPILCLPLFWLFGVVLIEGVFGVSPAEYYMLYLMPVITGVTWLLGDGLLKTLGKPALRYGFNGCFVLAVLVTMGHLWNTNPGHEQMVSMSRTPMPMVRQKMAGLTIDSQSATVYQSVEALYQQNHCEKRFLAVMDAASMFYYLFNRVSPFGSAWTDYYDYQSYAPMLKQQQSICMYYRYYTVDQKKGIQDPLAKGFYYLGLSEKPKDYHYGQIGSLYFLAVDR